MAESQGEVGFEVRVLQGDTWQIHARYSNAKQRTAVEDAKSLEKISTIKAVKVVRETYNEETGLTNEFDIYKSPSLIEQQKRESEERRAKQPAASPSPSAAAQRRARTDAKPKRAAKTAKPKGARTKEAAPRPGTENRGKKKSLFSGIIKLLLVVMVSIVLAVLVMLLAEFFLDPNRSLGARISAGARSNILIGVFVVAFLLSAFSMVSAFIKKGDLDISLDRRRQPVAQAAPAADEAPPIAESPAAVILPVEEPLSAYGETQKVYMMKFLGQSLEKVKAGRRTMDNFNLFGVNMYLAGACEALGQDRKLDMRTSSAILGDAVQAMGYKKNQAQSFADKYVEYLVADARYMQMYQAGRNAMNTTLTDDAGGAEQMEKALDEWNKPKVKEDKAGPVTVMFTDMVGSTNLTQTMGDEVAQQVVRAHNRIVREALNRFTGKEVKHTGDGIMASFAITSNCVEAAIFIQGETVKHNESNADLPLHLKVGINAGEPIAEDDDLFGTTVQVAARTVDKANSEQIFVTEIVHGICAGKGLKFFNRGQFVMKGVTEPITLYEAAWNDTIVAEEAAPIPVEDEAEAESEVEVEVEVEAVADEPAADQNDGATPAEEAAPSAEEEVAETEEAAATAPLPEPAEPEEMDETPAPEIAQEPPAATEEPPTDANEKAPAAGKDNT